ncbi:MAG: hypothetical protein E6J45_07725 [Chloroflexi bacterium]|nr:MAG: hypothetical protein E6J45_07725 [Chloroflexota bacterium]
MVLSVGSNTPLDIRPGKLDANGSISGSGSGASVTASKINLYSTTSPPSTATCSPSSVCTPSPTSSPKLLDPLSGKVPTPTVTGAKSCCVGGVIHPGVYSSANINNSTVWMTANSDGTTGQYVFTGGITIQGAGGGALSNTNASASSPAISYGSTTLVDTSKTWITSQWVGAVVTAAFPDGTSEKNNVTGNSATTLTLGSPWKITPPAMSGYTVYAPVVIYLSCAVSGSPGYGACATDSGGKTDSGTGSSVSYTKTTLTDTSKAWTANQWAGATVTSGTSTNTVISNTPTTLTMGTWGKTPKNGDPYSLVTTKYTATTLTDTSKSWTANSWSGATVTVTLAGGSTETATVASNTSNTLTVSAWSAPGTTPSTGNSYAIAKTGGYVSTTGHGMLSVRASEAPSDPYQGIALFSDPSLGNPVSNTCDASIRAMVCVGGNGGTIGGTIYLPKGTLDIAGGGFSGSGVSVAGYLVVRDVYVTGNGRSVLTVTGPTTNGGTCDYYDDPVVGQGAADGHFPSGSSVAARVEFNIDCSTSPPTTTSSIVGYAYGP